MRRSIRSLWRKLAKKSITRTKKSYYNCYVNYFLFLLFMLIYILNGKVFVTQHIVYLRSEFRLT